jgi:pullulanase
MGTSTTKPGVTLTTQQNSTKTPEFAFFSDSIRNTLKGGTFGGISAGYISGASVSIGELNSLFKGMPSWCKTPSQSINYISCHDNNTLYDHISLVKKNATDAEKAAMNKLGVAFYMTAQGIPFMQAGEEIMRSKPDASKPDGYNENSYNAPDAVNSIKWDTLNEALYQDVHDYYKGLIAFRKAHPALRLTTSDEVNANVTPLTGLDANVAAYQIKGGVNGETAEGIVAIFNANADAKTVTLPEGNWTIFVNGEDAGTTALGTASGTVTVNGVSAMVLVKGDVATPGTSQPGSSTSDQPADNTNWGLVIGIVAAVAVAAAAVVVILLKKK